MIIHNKIYNLKSLMGSHPGGDDILLSRAGTDATKDFEAGNPGEWQSCWGLCKGGDSLWFIPLEKATITGTGNC